MHLPIPSSFPFFLLWFRPTVSHLVPKAAPLTVDPPSIYPRGGADISRTYPNPSSPLTSTTFTLRYRHLPADKPHDILPADAIIAACSAFSMRIMTGVAHGLAWDSDLVQARHSVDFTSHGVYIAIKRAKFGSLLVTLERADGLLRTMMEAASDTSVEGMLGKAFVESARLETYVNFGEGSLAFAPMELRRARRGEGEEEGVIVGSTTMSRAVLPVATESVVNSF